MLVQREDKQLQHAVVRFCGYTKFCEGVVWVGVELDQAKGKNNGSVLVCTCVKIYAEVSVPLSLLYHMYMPIHRHHCCVLVQ